MAATVLVLAVHVSDWLIVVIGVMLLLSEPTEPAGVFVGDDGDEDGVVVDAVEDGLDDDNLLDEDVSLTADADDDDLFPDDAFVDEDLVVDDGLPVDELCDDFEGDVC